MSTLRIYLFGKFQVFIGEEILDGFEAPKVQDLFSYLVLYRDRPHPRETLSDLLWRDSPATDSRKCLRQALWRVQTILDANTESPNSPLLLIEPRWIQLNPEADLWTDVAELEQAFDLVQKIPAQDLRTQTAQAVQAALRLYRGDLLEGCYQDWCLFDRERYQSMYLGMLEKLMDYYEIHAEYEAGLACGTHILRFDGAHERTHRRLMRLHYLLGNRTAALRQYERCVTALSTLLNVGPSGRTLAIYEQIRSSQPASQSTSEGAELLKVTAPSLLQTLSQLKLLQKTLSETQRQLQHVVQVVETAMDK